MILMILFFNKNMMKISLGKNFKLKKQKIENLHFKNLFNNFCL